MRHEQSGQALLEFAICVPVVVAAVAVTLLLFRTEWNRARCARKAFLAAHQALRTDGGVFQVEKTDAGVKARVFCGSSVEEIQLPDLEHAQW